MGFLDKEINTHCITNEVICLKSHSHNQRDRAETQPSVSHPSGRGEGQCVCVCVYADIQCVVGSEYVTVQAWRSEDKLEELVPPSTLIPLQTFLSEPASWPLPPFLLH